MTKLLIRDSKTRPARSRSINTAHGYAERLNPPEEEPEAPRITIPRLNSRNLSPGQDAPSPGGYGSRQSLGRTSTFDTGARIAREGISRDISQREVSPARRLSRA